MDLFLDVNNANFVVSPVTTNQLSDVQFYLGNITPINLQLLGLNTSPSATIPYIVLPTASIDQSISVIVGIPSATSPVVVDSKTFGWNNTNQYWTGSLSFTGSNLVNMMLGGSSSYMEIHSSGSGYYTTLYQDTITVKPEITK
jgi:hypothetical protein